jgi:sigma-B regulation protein RsbU (phosphoserine phosphatase)
LDQATHILQAMPCGCMVFDDQGIIAFVNDTLCRMLVYNAEDLLGKSTEAILTISSRIFYQTHFFPLLKLKGEVNEMFLTLKAKDGSHIPVMVNAKADIKQGQVSYICVLATVFERQKYEEQLLLARNFLQKTIDENQDLNRLKSELESHQQELDRKLSALTERSKGYVQMGKVFMHDMQEPIRKISLYFDGLLAGSKYSPDSEDVKKLNIIKKSIARLRQLTTSLLDFVYVNSVKDEISVLSPEKLILQARDQVIIDLNNIDFDLHIEPMPEFEGNVSLIRRVFVELIKNAIQNTDPVKKPVINVKAILTQENIYQVNASKYKYTDHITIEFSDNGSGFDPKYASYIFGLLNKLSTNSSGVGLGLAMCSQIISHHYGTIKARSQPGHGTTMVIVLPLRQSG